MHTRTALRYLLAALLPLSFSCGGEADKKPERKSPESDYRSAVRRIQDPEQVAALGKIVPEDPLLELTFEAGGKISRINIQEGQTAEAGEPLILLDAALEENELQSLEAQLDRNRLEKEEARAQIAYYERVVARQEQSYRRLERSVEAEAIPASQLDQAELDLLNSRNQLDIQLRSLDRLEVETRQLEIRKEEVKLRRRQKSIFAPGRGIVIRWEVRESSGVQAQEVVGEFAPEAPLLVEAEVDEYFATDVKVGQAAVIKREGFPDTLARGQVIFTAPNLSRKSVFSEDNTEFQDLQVRRIKIRLEDGEPLLLGMKVEAIIQTAQKR